MLRKIARVVIGLIGLGIGYSLSILLTRIGLISDLAISTGYAWYLFVSLLILGTGLACFMLAPWLIEQTSRLVAFLENALQRIPAQDLIGGSIGLILGLVIANLLGAPMRNIPWVGPYIPVILSILFGYLGLSIGIRKKEELTGLLHNWKTGLKQGKTGGEHKGYKVLDTNVIIDGRISDICRTGFLDGSLLIPRFVLEELQHIADSSDVLRRNKGRRGLDILNQMQKEQYIKIEIRDFDGVDTKKDVDYRLIQVCKLLDCPVVTNDYNLNKVAELVGVKVLNINDLANAVKPLFIPGEEIAGVDVIRDGKEPGQGVAYLEDGTMIVIEGGKRHIGKRINVVVTSVLQTSAGRMIFAKPKMSFKDSSSGRYREVNAIG
ncbi:MAG: PIN/TRAM domain-containing protein [Syntrophaceticus sp.]|nr:PIN/TRAM domain-containing protein [Syntrophaceticus sp.]HBG22841.1 PIN domain nuclease [Peptococcaceae bacterium]MDD3314844.1 PIN/TRAM domain-containing protein [Syntrophaceticus sp.]MDD4359977.1 PIN/TRAM domain-containing protein [Syntrophaceticus sp.]MDD4783237.1 PIN/TRAM domain-containing protein [Syntrophaceticus sp.]